MSTSKLISECTRDSNWTAELSYKMDYLKEFESIIKSRDLSLEDFAMKHMGKANILMSLGQDALRRLGLAISSAGLGFALHLFLIAASGGHLACQVQFYQSSTFLFYVDTANI